MERFAFIIHPVDVRRDLARKFPLAAYAPLPFLEATVRHIPPMVTSHIVGIKSKTGVEAEGWFIVCPLTPTQLQTLARLLRPLDNPELGIVGLLTLASAQYADAELLKKTASLALTDAPLGVAAREYRRAVGGVIG